MPFPDTLARKITADFRAEKKYGGRKKICDALAIFLVFMASAMTSHHYLTSHSENPKP